MCAETKLILEIVGSVLFIIRRKKNRNSMRSQLCDNLKHLLIVQAFLAEPIVKEFLKCSLPTPILIAVREFFFKVSLPNHTLLKHALKKRSGRLSHNAVISLQAVAEPLVAIYNHPVSINDNCLHHVSCRSLSCPWQESRLPCAGAFTSRRLDKEKPFDSCTEQSSLLLRDIFVSLIVPGRNHDYHARVLFHLADSIRKSLSIPARSKAVCSSGTYSFHSLSLAGITITMRGCFSISQTR